MFLVIFQQQSVNGRSKEEMNNLLKTPIAKFGTFELQFCSSLCEIM